MPSVTVTHAGGGTDTIDATLGYQWTRELGKMFELRIQVTRDDAQAANLVPKEDEVELSGVTTGRLVDVNRRGATYELVVNSFEWDAKQETPTDGGRRISGSDEDIIDTLINEVSSWSVGTTNQLATGLSFVFNHAFRHEAIRRVEKNVPGEVRFNDDKTVDYVDQLGTDKSASVTISPSNANVTGDVTVERRGGKFDATHLRVIGAHEGEAQVFANLVPSADGATYDNRVDYSTSRWSQGDPRDWDRWENKDVEDQATIEEEAAALAGELKDEYLEVSATVENEDLVLGDTVKVEKPEAGVDRDLRIERIVTETVDGTPAATQDKLLLSTRNTVRDTVERAQRDIQRFNTAFQGNSVWGTVAGGIQAVDSGLDYTLSFFYPDVSFEHLIELQVKSLPYRAFSSGADAGGGDTTANNAEFSNAIVKSSSSLTATISDSGWTTVDSETPGMDTSYIMGMLEVENQDSSRHTIQARLKNTTTGYVFPDSSGNQMRYDPSAVGSFTGIDASNTNGETVELQLKTPSSTSFTVLHSTYYFAAGTHTHGQPAHSHPVDPGVTEFPNETASGVDVIVNGTTEATDIGTGTFETTVDLSGTLTKGAWNTVTVASDTLGLLQCTAAIDAYRKIGTS